MDGSAVSGKTNYYAVAAVDDCGASANSPAVAVFLPGSELTLNIAAVGGVLIVSWPGWAADWSLFSATNLTPPVKWLPLTNTVDSNSGGFTVSLPVGFGEQFFHLMAP